MEKALMKKGNLNLGQEREIAQEFGKGLEDALKDAKKIDRQITKSLNHTMNPLSRIPIVKYVVNKIRSIKPLASLEFELRTSLNNSLVSVVKVGRKTQEEKERIHQLNEIYDTARGEEWTPKEFIGFIEANTDISYTVSLEEGGEINLKEVFAEVDSKLLPEKKAEKQKEYFEWFQSHINLSEQYLDAMHALCFVGCEWIGGMSRSYFDLTQLRGGMEEIRKTLQNLGRGGIASMSSQQAIRQYGTAYINGMRNLLKGYKKMCALKDSGSNEFKVSLQQLETDLNSPNSPQKQEIKQYQTQGRLIHNPNN